MKSSKYKPVQRYQRNFIGLILLLVIKDIVHLTASIMLIKNLITGYEN